MHSAPPAPLAIMLWSGPSGEYVLLGLLLLAAATAGYFYYRMRREDAEEEAALDRELERRLKSTEDAAKRDGVAGTTVETQSVATPVSPRVVEAPPHEPLVAATETPVESKSEAPAISIHQEPKSSEPARIETSPSALLRPVEAAPVAEALPVKEPIRPTEPVAPLPPASIVLVQAPAPQQDAPPHAEQIVIASAFERPSSKHADVPLEDSMDEVLRPTTERPASLNTKPLDPHALRPVTSSLLKPESLPPRSKRVLHRTAPFEMREERPASPPSPLPPRQEVPAQHWTKPPAPSREDRKKARDTEASPFEGLHIFADPAVAERAREELLREMQDEQRSRHRRRSAVLSIMMVIVVAVGLAFAIPSSRQRLMPRVRPYTDQLAVLFGLKAPKELVKTVEPDVECSDYRLRSDTKANTFEFGGEVTNVSPDPLRGLQVEIELQPRTLNARPKIQVVPLEPSILAPGLTGTFHFGGASNDFQSAKVGRILGPGGDPLHVKYKGLKEWPVSSTASVRTVSAPSR